MKNKNKAALYVIVILITAVIGGVLFYNIREKRIKEERQNTVAEYRKKVEALSKKCVPFLEEGYTDLLQTERYFEKVEVTEAYFTYRGLDTYSVYGDSLEYYCRISIIVSNEFDKLSENEQYEVLQDYYYKTEYELDNILYEKMPEVEELEGSIRAYSKEELDVSFYSCEDFAFVLKTDQNTYEYATRVDDYYIVNGEGRFTPKHWEEYHKNHPKPTPKPKKKSSSGNGKKIIFNGSDDPYEVDMYDDPEDFWEDHEDEFEDFEDAWDYWEENQ